jgi:hypothetical protein
MKAVLAAQTQPRFLGGTDHWSRRIIFPNSGNPNGFPKAGGIALGVPHRGRLRPAPGSRHDVLFRARFRVGILEIGSRVRFLPESERGPVRSVGSVLHRCEVELRLRRVHEVCHRRRDARRQDWPFASNRADPENSSSATTRFGSSVTKFGSRGFARGETFSESRKGS